MVFIVLFLLQSLIYRVWVVSTLAEIPWLVASGVGFRMLSPPKTKTQQQQNTINNTVITIIRA
jgi:hypothetical protein